MRLGHGDDAANYPGAGLVSNFSSNVYTGYRDEALLAYLRSQIEQICSYPQPDAAQLRNVVAQREGVRPAQVAVFAGATEAFYLIAQAFPNRRSILAAPTFSEYADAAKLHGHCVRAVAQFSKETLRQAQVAWICNPNNPTGATMRREQLVALVEAYPECLFVLDQSYASFSLEAPLSSAEAVTLGHVLLVHSLTKEYRIPGLRLGYVTGSAELLSQLVACQPPWTVNTLAQLAGLYLLAWPRQAFDLPAYLEESRRFQHAMAQIPGVSVTPSPVHFFLCRLRSGLSAAALKQWLIAQHGMLIRDASNFDGLGPEAFRVCTQRPEENMRLVAAITAWMRGQ